MIRKAVATVIMIATLPTGTSIAWAKPPCERVGPSREIICVCNKRYCWVEPGTQYRFDALFDGARALTASGTIGVWRPFKVRPLSH
jgi:hypothetical protein